MEEGTGPTMIEVTTMDGMTARHLATLRAGRPIDPVFANGAQAQEAIRIYTAEGGTASAGTARDLYRRQYQLDREFAAHFKSQHPDARYVTRPECAQVVALALDEYHGETLTAKEAGVHVFGEQHASTCMKRDITAKALRAGLADNRNHAGYQALVKLNGRREVSKQAAGGTMSGLYNSLVNGTRVAKRMEALERNQAEMMLKLAELEAFKVQQEQRNKVTDTGGSMKELVVSLYQSGKGYKAVSAETGVSVSTVRNWIKAAGI